MTRYVSYIAVVSPEAVGPLHLEYVVAGGHDVRGRDTEHLEELHGGPWGSVIPTLDDPCVAYIKSMISTKKVLIIISKISLTSKETVKVKSNRR